MLRLTCLLATACYNPDERCSEGQEYSEDDELCVCRTGLTLTEDGCEKPAKGPAGNAPDPSDDDPAPEQDAGEDDEPPAGPEGLGRSCTANDDCAGTDATFCDTLITGGCLLEGCALGGSDCPAGYECQDLSMFGAAGNVCVAATCDLAGDDCPDGFSCCEASIPGFPPVCLSAGCGG
jgi:hypothetical protein